MLTGWDFQLNPRQWGNVNATATPAYIWDQTIMGTATGTVVITADSATSGLHAVNGSANEAFYLLQYLSGSQAKKMLGTKLSVNINAYAYGNQTNVVARVYLYRGSAAAGFPAVATPFATFANTGLLINPPANWTLINRGQATAPMATAEGIMPAAPSGDFLTTIPDLGFSGWEITDAAQINDTDKFAIVVTFQVPTLSSAITIDSISLVPGDIPTRPAPQTADEVLRECQYYFETSYVPGAVSGASPPVGSVTVTGQRFVPVQLSPGGKFGNLDVLYLQSYSLTYDQIKRIAVTPYFYSPASGTSGQVQGVVLQNGNNIVPGGVGLVGSSPANYAITKWTLTASSPKSVTMVCNSTTTVVYNCGSGSSPSPNEGDESFLLYQYVADARLGVI